MEYVICSFKEWLDRFKGVDWPIGDLQADVAKDPTFPSESRDHDEIRAYLERRASNAALETFEECYEFYQKSHLDAPELGGGFEE
ncbi:YozE family protein [Lacticaseibacillus absianus]|uniref:YozE family protein n=1 Tax=Lacticaseibacillus absianus TaxID=2729623 RepID=UPI0015C83A6B|nr:YozE family protein [Lacticaseibacillus absianus]